MKILKNIFLLLIAVLLIGTLSGCLDTDLVSNNVQNDETVKDNPRTTKEIDDLSSQNNEVFNNDNLPKDTDKEASSSQSNDEKLGSMEVHFIDVGQADSALLQFDGYNILIDAGDWNRNEVVPYLKSKGVDKIDVMIGSHPHADHIGQMDKVLENFKVDEVWMSGGSNSSAVFKRVLDVIENNGSNYDEPRAGDVYEVGNAKIDIISPSSLTGNLNDDSIVMKVTYGDVSFLFTGDAELSAENKMVNSEKDLSADILKVGHHGSDTSTSDSFLNKVNPDVAIISVAEKSKYNHPNKSVVDRLNSKVNQLYTTKSHGNIIIKTDGKSYSITTEKKDKIIPGDINSTKKANEKPSKSMNNSTSSSNPVKIDKPISECININTASKDELMKIKHIGSVTADKVIDARPFNSIDELTKVSGIAEKKLADIKDENFACSN